MKKALSSLFILSALALAIPQAHIAAQEAPPLDYSGFVKCDGVVKRDASGTILPGEEKRNKECDFAALMETIIKLVNFLFYISIPLATVLFAYGGVLYMTGKQENIKTAKKMFASAAIGFIIMATGWIMVRTVVGWVVGKNSTATTFIK